MNGDAVISFTVKNYDSFFNNYGSTTILLLMLQVLGINIALRLSIKTAGNFKKCKAGCNI
ncbi:hypothetical protein BH10BAC2_BH10BAC2_42240 [soil metagenome]